MRLLRVLLVGAWVYIDQPLTSLGGGGFCTVKSRTGVLWVEDDIYSRNERMVCYFV